MNRHKRKITATRETVVIPRPDGSVDLYVCGAERYGLSEADFLTVAEAAELIEEKGLAPMSDAEAREIDKAAALLMAHPRVLLDRHLALSDFVTRYEDAFAELNAILARAADRLGVDLKSDPELAEHSERMRKMRRGLDDGRRQGREQQRKKAAERRNLLNRSIDSLFENPATAHWKNDRIAKYVFEWQAQTGITPPYKFSTVENYTKRRAALSRKK